MRTYSELEKNVLSKFFTNLDSNVYCATDAMPTSLWAFLEGGYSRSELNMRDRFLSIFNEMDSENYDQLLTDMLGDYTTNQTIARVLDKAEQFMRKWAIQYSHASLKDSAVDRIAIENVSIRATKVLEDSSLGAFQEKSTRYMDFSVDNFYIPESEHITDEHRQILTDAMTLYRKVLDSAIEYFKTIISREEFKTEGAWIRTCRAKAFDEARYCLPTSIRTSLGVTLPTRETERWISKMLAAPEQEIRDLAEQIKTECIKINPGLLKHVEPNEYLNIRSLPFVQEVFNHAVPQKASVIPVGVAYRCNAGETAIATAFCAEMGLFTAQSVKSVEDKLDVLFDQVLEARGKFDEFPKFTAAGENEICFTMDIGGYRDIQRHRVGTQIPADWSPSYGYSIPDYLEVESASELKNEYIALCDRIADVSGKLYEVDRFNAAYFLILGTNIRVLYICNFKQAAYFIELRSGASGHYSYRRIAQELYTRMENSWPTLHKYIRVDMSGYGDRRIAEEKMQEKLNNLENEK